MDEAQALTRWKQIIFREEKEQILYASIDVEQIKAVRKENPVFENRREDLFLEKQV